jgi:hypothetical protein
VKCPRRLFAVAVVLAASVTLAEPSVALVHAPAAKSDAAAPLQKRNTTATSGALASRMPVTYSQAARRYPPNGYPPPWQPRR